MFRILRQKICNPVFPNLSLRLLTKLGLNWNYWKIIWEKYLNLIILQSLSSSLFFSRWIERAQAINQKSRKMYKNGHWSTSSQNVCFYCYLCSKPCRRLLLLGLEYNFASDCKILFFNLRKPKYKEDKWLC